MKFATKSLIIAVALAAIANPVAGAEAPVTAPPGDMPEEYTWFNGDDDAENASLLYGNKESAEDITLAMNCTRRSGKIKLFVAETSEKLKPGQQVTVTLTAGNVNIPVKAKITANEMAGVPSAEGDIPATAPIFAVMTEPGTLAISIADWSTSVPMKGIGTKAADFAAACRK